MGLYERLVLPLLLDWAMRDHRLAPYRSRAIDAAAGLVLEIGAGSGLNFPRYADTADRVVALDPSPSLLRLAARRRGEACVPVSLLCASGELPPFPDAVFDTAVTTWTLCSVADPLAALRQARRVLKPGGKLLFVEHGLSPAPRIAAWQHRLTPCWKAVAGGCHLDRRIDQLIRAAGFRIDRLDTGHMPGPKPWTFMYQGSASPA
jgi:ubiquinone/menaquinone biosynthesis C-methylase UbiE